MGRVSRTPFSRFLRWMLLGSSFERLSPLAAETKACCLVSAVTRRATLICPEGRASPQGCGTGKVTRTSKGGFGGGLGKYSLSPPPPPLFPTTGLLRPFAAPAPISFAANVKVSGWPEPDRTGHRLGRVKRKRCGARAPPPSPPAASRLGCASASASAARHMPYV